MAGSLEQAHFLPFIILSISALDIILPPGIMCLPEGMDFLPDEEPFLGIASLLQSLELFADRFTHGSLDPLHDGPVERDNDGQRPTLLCRGELDFLLAEQGDAALAVLWKRVHGLASRAVTSACSPAFSSALNAAICPITSANNLSASFPTGEPSSL